MNTLAEVCLWGRTIGAVQWDDAADHAVFEYAPAFLSSGIEVAPLQMPLARGGFRFPQLRAETFSGLPGLLADSLPDRYGHALIDAWLARQGRTPDSFNPVERLCYIGTRGMGALEFTPSLGPQAQDSQELQVDALVSLASEILSQRSDLEARLGEDAEAREGLRQILQVGTSAGGARAKAVVAWNPSTDEVRSGQVPVEEGFEPWLLKFDGVRGNRDKELEDPQGYGRIEYAYHQMALASGVEMEPCRLLEENGRAHFMTRRFDRTSEGKKVHMQSLGAMAHFDYNLAGAHGYEQAMLVMRQLGMGLDVVEQQLRRMIFNLVARNQDDHVKNIAYLMDKAGQWSLSPAFDVTYSYRPDGQWTGRHQMSVNGKRDDFTLDDLRACARAVGLKERRADVLLREVLDAVEAWPQYAQLAGVPAPSAAAIQSVMRLEWSQT